MVPSPFARVGISKHQARISISSSLVDCTVVEVTEDSLDDGIR